MYYPGSAHPTDDTARIKLTRVTGYIDTASLGRTSIGANTDRGRNRFWGETTRDRYLTSGSNLDVNNTSCSLHFILFVDRY